MRDFEQIRYNMGQEQSKYPAFPNDSVINPSSTSILDSAKNFFAFMGEFFERSLDNHYDRVLAKLSSQQVGTKSWYLSKILAFQYGDALSVNADKVFYEVVDKSKNSVKKVAIQELPNNKLLVKVRGVNDTVLGVDEIEALKEYVSEIKFLGTTITVISQTGDKVFLKLMISYNRLLMNAQGQQLGNTNEYPVLTLISQFFNQKLAFGDELRVSAFESYIYQSAFVDQVVIQQISVQGFPATEKVSFLPLSGSFVLDSTSIITYI
jgi:hypothetical protein